MTDSRLVATLRMPAGRQAATDDHAKPRDDETTVGVRHPAIRARARLNRVGGRVPLKGETEVVASLLLSKLAHSTPDDDQQVADTLEIRKAFLQHRFTNRLSAYDRGDRFYRHLDTTLNLASIAAGIAASLLVASATAKAWTIVLAVGIAGCQTLSQWLKPAERAGRRGRAASASSPRGVGHPRRPRPLPGQGYGSCLGSVLRPRRLHRRTGTDERARRSRIYAQHCRWRRAADEIRATTVTSAAPGDTSVLLDFL